MTDDAAPLGHIKLARKAFDDEHGDRLWLEPRVFSRWEAWVDVIQLAAWRSHRQSTRQFGVVDLQRGEFVASLRWLADRWHWSIKRVRVWVATCEKGARLRAQRETTAGTVYLVVNYETYQGSGHSRGTAKGTDEDNAGAQQGHKTEAVKASKAITTTPDVDVVTGHYLARHPRRRIGPKDCTAVAKALTLGYSAAELCEAIDGNATDAWHREKHKHELPYVLRDAGKIDDFRDKAVAQKELDAAPMLDGGWMSPAAEAASRPT